MRVVRMAAAVAAHRPGVNPDLQPGQWEFSFSTRASTADKHYSLDEEQTQRQTLGTYVVNKQRAYDFALRYQANSRFGTPYGSADRSVRRRRCGRPPPHRRLPSRSEF